MVKTLRVVYGLWNLYHPDYVAWLRHGPWTLRERWGSKVILGDPFLLRPPSPYYYPLTIDVDELEWYYLREFTLETNDYSGPDPGTLTFMKAKDFRFTGPNGEDLSQYYTGRFELDHLTFYGAVGNTCHGGLHLHTSDAAPVYPGWSYDVQMDVFLNLHCLDLAPTIINGGPDGVINIYDVMQLTQRFDLRRGEPGWDDKCERIYDLNMDGVINIYDIVKMTSNYGWHSGISRCR